VLSSGGELSLEITSKGGESAQIGLRGSSEPNLLVVGEKRVRLEAAGARCSHPLLRTVPAVGSEQPRSLESIPMDTGERTHRSTGEAPDAMTGTFVGRAWMGVVVLEVNREGDEYHVVMNPDALAPMRGTAKIDERGGIAGELSNRVLGVENRDTFWLRPEAAGLRFRTRGINIIVERQ
jgi:hypothetical protein